MLPELSTTIMKSGFAGSGQSPGFGERQAASSRS
jgi:hypothetical protein